MYIYDPYISIGTSLYTEVTTLDQCAIRTLALTQETLNTSTLSLNTLVQARVDKYALIKLKLLQDYQKNYQNFYRILRLKIFYLSKKLERMNIHYMHIQDDVRYT